MMREDNSFPSWVHEAKNLPVAFAQVREDALIDKWVVKHLSPDASIALVASGGCTAAFLATIPNVAQLQLVDSNPSQLALTRLKIRLLQTCDSTERLAILGHRSMPVQERQNWLARELSMLDLAEDSMGPLSFMAQKGPDYSGRYECLFAALQHGLSKQADELIAILSLSDPSEQSRRIASNTDFGRLLDKTLEEVMALTNLVQLFGKDATANPLVEFSRHFAKRIRHAFATLPAANNPYLWQMLCGRYPEKIFSPWLSQPLLNILPEINYRQQFMVDALREQPDTFDFVHLSNILDWLSEAEAISTLEVTQQALKPGGWMLIRQLNSSLDIPKLGPMFDWHTSDAQQLHSSDRSFFYRTLHLGRKR
jgi:S-adenosylmethionine-diacylglycerol 3-amino-3-carboxypropyl transferase